MVTTFYPPDHFGGDAVHVQSLARALVRAGHDVEVVCFTESFRAAGGSAAVASAFVALDWDGVQDLHRGGVAIESHTHGHRDLRRLSRARGEDECARADALIEQHVGRLPRYFAYPHGHHDAIARHVASERYRAAFATRLAALRDGDDRYALPRLDAHYLRDTAVHRRLDGARTRAWLAWRAALRRLRGRP